MAFQLGTDEAGYGPNLGPLVIAGSRWQVPSPETDLFEILAEAVSRGPDGERLWLADSKRVGQGPQGMARLELGVLSLLTAANGHCPAGPAELLECLGQSFEQTDDWFVPPTGGLPRFTSRTEIERTAKRLRDSWDARGCQLDRIAVRMIVPEEFNHLINRRGNKANLLSGESLQLANHLLEGTGSEPACVVCDKHGGRKHYARWLQEYVAGGLVQVHHESPRQSDYGWQENGRRIEFSFRAGGEANLAVAVASMTAKYVRELSMLAWNEFWQAEIPELRPTKGYPLDARRFKRQIAPRQKELGIDDTRIWRAC